MRVVSLPADTMEAVPPEPTARAPLVGRAAELDRLAGLAGVRGEGDPAGASQVSAVLLAGDAGIGKTRLLAALRARAVEAGVRVLVGHCLDLDDAALPYLPVSELLGRLEADDPQRADRLLAAHPALSRVLPHRPADPAPGDPADQVDRGELFSAVHAAVEGLAADGPLLLLVEDVHWADQSTRDLLTFLLTRGFTGPVTLVVSYRSDDLHRRHPLRATAAHWGRLAGVARVELGPLPDTEVRVLVRHLHRVPLREAAVHEVVARAGGNALYAEELVAATELGESAFPPDLAGLLLVRVDQLDPPARQVVRAASVGGRGLVHETLAAVLGEACDLSADAVEDGVRAAVERNVLVVNGEGYAFRHALLGEAVYADLLPGERVRLHAAYVGALRGRTEPGTAAALARHARAAHDLGTALEASICAGDEATAAGGPAEALRHYRTALELADAGAAGDPDPPTDVGALTVRAAAAATAAGHVAKALALLQDRLATLAADGAADTDPAGRAVLLGALARTAVLTDVTDVDAVAAAAEAVRLAPAGDDAVRARLLGTHAHALADRWRDDEATERAEEARALAAELGLQDVVADTSTTLARVQVRRGDPAGSRLALQRVIDDARTRDDPAELRGLHHLGGLHLERGELSEALAAYRTGADRAARLGLSWAPYGLDARVLAAVVAYQVGEWDTVAGVVDVAGESPPGVAEASLAAAGLAVAAGRGEATARSLLPAIRGWWERDGLVAVLTAGAGIDLHGDAGELDQAQAVHDDAVATVGGLWRQPDFHARIRLSALLLGQLVVAARHASGAERAALAARGAEPAAAAERAAGRTETHPAGRLKRPLGPEGLAWQARARAEWLRLRWVAGVDVPAEPELVDAWRDAVARFEAYPHAFELARSRTRLAEVLRATGDAGAAREASDAARETAHRLRAEPLLAELRGLAPARGRHPAGAPDESLTPREHEVLRLVARGSSNREIAGSLYISAKTVSVHVSNILAKLSASGRTEAVAVARRRGLLDD